MTTGGRSPTEPRRGSATNAATAGPSSRVLRRRRHFAWHLLAFVTVNVVLVGIWLIRARASGNWFFWPVFVLVAWALVLDVHAMWAYGQAGQISHDIS